MEKRSYLAWIANLGVLPLLVFFFLRLSPNFTFLFLLLILVFLVRETMVFLSCEKCSYLKNILPRSMMNVKSFCLLLFISQSMVVMGQESVILAIGEQQQLPVGAIKNYSVGVRDILNYRYQPQKGLFLIKGKKLGFTDLMIWNKKGKLTHYKVYVLSKQNHLSLMRLSETFTSMGLKTSINGPILVIEGEIKQQQDLKVIHQLTNDYKKYLFIKANLSSSLRNKIIAEVYQLFFKEGLFEVSCQSEGVELMCQYAHETDHSQKLMQEIEKKYPVHFAVTASSFSGKNYKAKLKIIQLERLDGKEFSLGLQQLSGTLQDFFQRGIVSLVEKNQILLEELHTSLSTLAEPELLLRPKIPAEVQVGAEIPYSLNTLQATSTQWKFAGLKIELILQEKGERLLIDYSNEFTRPSPSGDVSGSKEKSSVLLRLQEPVVLFQIGLKTFAQGAAGIPLIKDIPLLGEIFTSQSNQETYKKIVGLLQIEALDV